jgi:hypothetical protein
MIKTPYEEISKILKDKNLPSSDLDVDEYIR